MNLEDFSSSLKEQGLRPNTIREYMQTVLLYISWLCGKQSTPAMVKAFLSERWGGDGLKPRSYARHLAGLRALFKFLEEDLPGVKTPRFKANSPRWLSEEESRSLLKSCNQTPETRAIIWTLYGGGLRAGELLSLRTDSWDPDGFLTVETKGGGTRVVPVEEEVIQAIREYLDWPGRSDPHNIRVFAFGYTYLAAVVKYVAAAAGISKRVTPHTLRHSIASAYIARGVPVFDVSQFLGHKSIKTTEIYLHSRPVDLKKRLPKMLGS